MNQTIYPVKHSIIDLRDFNLARKLLNPNAQKCFEFDFSKDIMKLLSITNVNVDSIEDLIVLQKLIDFQYRDTTKHLYKFLGAVYMVGFFLPLILEMFSNGGHRQGDMGLLGICSIILYLVFCPIEYMKIRNGINWNAWDIMHILQIVVFTAYMMFYIFISPEGLDDRSYTDVV